MWLITFVGGIVEIMKCNLVKKIVKSGEKSFTNYYLVFENGNVLPVVCKSYTTKATDKKEIEKVEKFNTTNFIKFSTLADLLDDDESR